MLVRNDFGAEGLVAWRKIQARPDAPVRLALGYAIIVDTAQGSVPQPSTSTRCRGGSGAIRGFKAQTDQSRLQRTTWIVIDEASERRRLAACAMLGHRPHIHEPDVWRAIGENLSRRPEKKRSALAVLHTAPEMAWQRRRHRAAALKRCSSQRGTPTLGYRSTLSVK